MGRLYRFAAVAACVAILSGIALVAQATRTAGAKMAAAANTFLGSLTPEQKAKAFFPFESPERVKWNFIPLQDKDKKPTRKGIRFEELSEGQKAAALNLLKAGLSEKAYGQATTIMSLESLLKELEGNGAMVRNPNWYFVSIFGQPSNDGKWGWRIEGHHLSVNLTLDKGAVLSATPIQLGANPAEVKSGSRKGLRTLPEIEDLAKELIKTLDADQLKIARQAKQFGEVEAKPRVPASDPIGLPYAKMTDAQKAILWKLMEAYATRATGEAAEDELNRAKAAGLDKVCFGYCIDEKKPGKPYTYRVQGPTFVIEFLNVQADSAKNPANHIHSAWRTLPADFGLEK
ncbi:MAG TPA: DUF3500 domain-containing protein [Fimbriiglobus sp.]|jgi:hypothetical protein